MRAVKGSLGHSPKERYRELEDPRLMGAVGPTRVSFQEGEASALGRAIYRGIADQTTREDGHRSHSRLRGT